MLSPRRTPSSRAASPSSGGASAATPAWVRRARRRLAGPTRGLTAVATLLAVCGAATPPPAHAKGPRARAPKPPPSVRAPQRLTAGESDQFLGVADPAGTTLYFISNQNATAQVFRQRLPSGTPERLFTDAADVSWPRPSPDGSKLLYISTRDDATGDACVRNADGTGRRCLTDATSAESQAFWFPNGDVGVVTRQGLHGDLRVRRLTGKGRGPYLVSESVGSPDVSPDGRWLVWVPVRRGSRNVGVSFAMTLGRGLRVKALTRPGAQPTALHFNLPGATGFPAFSRDGRYLYFAQHLSDTNGDGRIDGDDHSVLFRARFNPRAHPPVDPDSAEQLTSADWNCQYPAPGRRQLVATCAQGGSLDVYGLPLDGAVPAQWGEAKLKEALDAARDPWARLLLLDHLRRRARSPQLRIARLRAMAEQHLRLDELSSTAWYARQAAQRPGASAQVRAWAAVTQVLVAHRRDETRLNRGELNDRFVAEQRVLLRKLKAAQQGGGRDVRALATAIRAEILDVLGHEGAALRLLKQLRLSRVRDVVILATLAERVPDRLAALGDRSAGLATLRVLADHKRLSDSARLAMAERFVELLLRGRDASERAADVATWRKGLDPDSHLAFRLDLEALLLKLTPATQESVRAAVFKLYRHSRELPRRRALVSATVRRAAAADNAYLLYQFANSWVSWMSRDHAERTRAVDLYRQVVLERAYISWAQRKHGDARGSFWGVTLQTDDLEAFVGFYETRVREGKRDALTLLARRYRRTPNHPALAFMRAYHQAWTLATVRDPERRAKTVASASASLQIAAAAWPQSAQVHHLQGYLAHQRLLAGGARGEAIGAHAHYLMALDLARGNPRVEASVLHALGMLQAAVGNHHIALDYLRRRARLPFLQPVQRLSLRIAEARSLAHVGRLKQAASVAQAAVAFVDETPPLERFLPMVLDRAVLWSWAAGDAAKATQLAKRLTALPAQRGGQARTWLVTAAARLAAGDAKGALVALAAFDRRVDASPQPAPRAGGVIRFTAADLKALADGLRAQALALSGAPTDALRALARRRAALMSRAEGGDDNAWRLVASCDYHSAALHRLAGAHGPAETALVRGLAAARTFAKRTGTESPDVRLALLLAWTRLAVRGQVQRQPALVRDAVAVYRSLGHHGHPSTVRVRAELGLHLTRLDLTRPGPATPGGP